jgi:hypothetical protein
MLPEIPAPLGLGWVKLATKIATVLELVPLLTGKIPGEATSRHHPKKINLLMA